MRSTPTVVALADATSLTPDIRYDVNTQTNTQAGGTLTVNKPIGNGNPNQLLMLVLKTTNQQTYSFGSGITNMSANGPTASTAGKTDSILLRRNALSSSWDIIAYVTN